MLKKRGITKYSTDKTHVITEERTKLKEKFENSQFSSGSSSDWYPELSPKDVPEEALGRGC